ncbi:RecG-like helicase [Natronocella acetinitrilica]|uniref:RecG-like helicase n=1 Tax=Natronocella acetinitrilica TaxID=414046 RepID=A0AAE3G1X4_9GAMM|nr:DEAD/DEAH box helicase [Natronocella acetinitrilica]MCP1674221.1 RecG-like helicase [Natronocella acetinitrilica]
MSTAKGLDGRAMGRLKALGINAPEELLLLPPQQYLDLRRTTGTLEGARQSGERAFLRLKLVSGVKVYRDTGKPPRASLMVSDGISEASITVFGLVAPWQGLRKGSFISVLTRVETWGDRLTLKSPELIPAHELGRIVARYPGKEKAVRPETVGRYVLIALQAHMEECIGHIIRTIGMPEAEILRRAGVDCASLRILLERLHRPITPEDVGFAMDAVRRINALGALTERCRPDDAGRESAGESAQTGAGGLCIPLETLTALVQALPFQPTRDQRRAIWDIYQDLVAERPMDRVLTGDVGSGKTLAYGLPAAAACKAGYQSVIMMPNLLLATQVADELRELFPGLPVELLVSGHGRTEAFAGKPVIVGTSAILHWAKALPEPLAVDLLVIDEQQKFGTEQRAVLVGPRTNRLEATATPIPRTAALMNFGNKGISRIQSMPVEKHIRSHLIGPDEGQRVLAGIERAVASGYKAVVLYPTRESDKSQYLLAIPRAGGQIEAAIRLMRANGASRLAQINDPRQLPPAALAQGVALESHLVATYSGESGVDATLAQVLAEAGVAGAIALGETAISAGIRDVTDAALAFERRFPGRVGMLHGGLKRDDKVQRIAAIKAGAFDVVVSTSVLEIGITIPDLRFLYVVDANVYGAMTLHQIRGRLARKGGNGTFVMGADRPLDQLQPETRARLELVLGTNDGFEIAQGELRQRGFGRLARGAEEQSGFESGLFRGAKVTPEDIESLLATAVAA